MLFLIGLLTVILVADCAILAVLVLIQLPKKEAGAGLAFGGAATDALFGAGSGNVLTKITKYAATIFFVLSITLSAMQSRFHNRTTNSDQFLNNLQQTGQPGTAPIAPPPTPSTTPVTSGSNQPGTTPAEATNVPAPAPTSSAPQTNK